MERAYVGSSLVLSVLLAVLGAAMIVSALVRGGGVLSFGVVIGACLFSAGAARLWLMRAARGERG